MVGVVAYPFQSLLEHLLTWLTSATFVHSTVQG